ncbi:MAG: methyltransferase domain-containing protein [Parvibaculaceae bacterium]|nr:methyltransferase domain-containing protein [Parvibaculaceae bacterium]
MAGPLDRWGYGVAQGARVAWYIGHYLAVNRMRGPLTGPGEEPFRPSGNVPGLPRLLKAMRRLFEQDWRNVEAGIYPRPNGLPADPVRALEKSLLFFRDVPEVDKRRIDRRHAEVLTPELRARYPRYYLQNFHYQTDGWLSAESARLYDTQVEVLFSGTADAMRRQALVPLAGALKGRDQRALSLLDLACGTGSFVADLKDSYPRLNVTLCDLSPAYLAEARKRLRGRRALRFLEANVESVPLPDESQDAISCIYLFHELPPRVRRTVAAEIARLLKPGGMAVIVDSLQTGDDPGSDGLLEFFPVGFHEPYFHSYLAEDFPALFARAGLTFEGQTPAFLSKVMVVRKAG